MGLGLGRKISKSYFKSARKHRKKEGGLFFTTERKKNIRLNTKSFLEERKRTKSIYE